MLNAIDQAKIKEIISNELGVSEVEIAPTSKLMADLGAGAFEVTNIAVAVERELRITVRDEDIGGFVTVQNIYDYVEKTRK